MERIVYIDRNGAEHDAIPVAVNPFKGDLLTLVYVEGKEPVKLYDVQHMSDPAKAENNPDLPSYQLNCWKFVDEEHTAPADDHPAFDKPFKLPDTDINNRRIPVQRPEYEAQVKGVHALPMQMEVVQHVEPTYPVPIDKLAELGVTIGTHGGGDLVISPDATIESAITLIKRLAEAREMEHLSTPIAFIGPIPPNGFSKLSEVVGQVDEVQSPNEPPLSTTI